MKLFVSASSTDEYGDSPAYAAFEVDEEFVTGIKRLQSVVTEHKLHSVSTWGSPDSWQRGEDLRLRGDKLVVNDTTFWFSAYPKYGSYHVETLSMSIAALEQLFEGKPNPDEFQIDEGNAYYGISPEDVADDGEQA